MPQLFFQSFTPQRPFVFSSPTNISLRVTGNGTMYLGHTASEVQTKQGMTVVATDGAIERTWSGELWIICDDVVTLCEVNKNFADTSPAMNEQTTGFGAPMNQPTTPGEFIKEAVTGAAIFNFGEWLLKLFGA